MIIQYNAHITADATPICQSNLCSITHYCQDTWTPLIKEASHLRPRETIPLFFRQRTMASDLGVLTLIPDISYSVANSASASWRLHSSLPHPSQPGNALRSCRCKSRTLETRGWIQHLLKTCLDVLHLFVKFDSPTMSVSMSRWDEIPPSQGESHPNMVLTPNFLIPQLPKPQPFWCSDTSLLLQKTPGPTAMTGTELDPSKWSWTWPIMTLFTPSAPGMQEKSFPLPVTHLSSPVVWVFQVCPAALATIWSSSPQCGEHFTARFPFSAEWTRYMASYQII